jgi:hypothetical protein
MCGRILKTEHMNDVRVISMWSAKSTTEYPTCGVWKSHECIKYSYLLIMPITWHWAPKIMERSLVDAGGINAVQHRHEQLEMQVRYKQRKCVS